MKNLVLCFILLIGVQYPEAAARDIGTRIINGDYAETAQFPWMAAIYITRESGIRFCGGSLITDQWVLTSASCAFDATNFTLYLGSYSLTAHDPYRKIIQTNYYALHPDFHPSTFVNDVALIQLPEPLPLTNQYIQPITLSVAPIGFNLPVYIAGWGKQNDASVNISPDLLYASLTTISGDECNSYYGDVIDYRIGCAMGSSQNVCSGDEGGPVFIYDSNNVAHQIGVASFVSSEGCEAPHPMGFTRSSYTARWVSEVTGLIV